MPTDPGFVSIRTDRLIVRRFGPPDITAFSAYRSDPEVARYQGWDPPYSVEEAASFVASLGRIHPGTLGAWFQFAIEERATGRLVGDCGLRPDADEPGLAELGFTLARRGQGRGFAREAIPALLDYAARRLGVRRIVAMTDARNVASISLLEDLGLRKSGTRMVLFKGERCEEHEYRMDGPSSQRPS